MAKVKADKEDVADRDAAQALSWNALIDPGQEIVVVILLIPQDRIPECVYEQTVDASLPRELVLISSLTSTCNSAQRSRSQLCPFLKSWVKAFQKSRCRTTRWSRGDRKILYHKGISRVERRIHESFAGSITYHATILFPQCDALSQIMCNGDQFSM